MTSLTSVLTAERVSILLSLCPLLLIKLQLPLPRMCVFPCFAAFCEKLPFSIEQFPPFARRPNSGSIPYPPITRESRGALFFAMLRKTQIIIKIARQSTIHRMCLWLVPTKFDLAGTIGVVAVNIIVGGIIGGFALV